MPELHHFTPKAIFRSSFATDFTTMRIISAIAMENYSTIFKRGTQPIVPRARWGSRPSVSLKSSPSQVISDVLTHSPLADTNTLILWRPEDTHASTGAIEHGKDHVPAKEQETKSDDSRSLVPRTYSTFSTRPIYSPPVLGADGMYYQIRCDASMTLKGIPPGVKSLAAMPQSKNWTVSSMARNALSRFQTRSSAKAPWPVGISCVYALRVVDEAYRPAIPSTASLTSHFAIVPLSANNRIAPTIREKLVNRLRKDGTGFLCVSNTDTHSRQARFRVQDSPGWPSYLNRPHPVSMTLRCTKDGVSEPDWHRLPGVLLAPGNTQVDVDAVGSLFPSISPDEARTTELQISFDGPEGRVAWPQALSRSPSVVTLDGPSLKSSATTRVLLLPEGIDDEES